MTYVLDSNSFIVLGHYFPARFPSFWERFNDSVTLGEIISVREVFRELDNLAARDHLRDWINENPSIFLPPGPDETEFVSDIFSNPHFQALVRKKNLLAGTPVADPFVIASAHIRGACVITEEDNKPNAAQIPNVCDHYGIKCTNLEGLMERESWVF